METKTIAHLVYVPFTGLGKFGGFRGDEWLCNRIRIFQEYTLQSLMSQKNMNYTLWLSFRPEERNNPLVKELENILTKLRGLTAIFTYHGLCFYDDKVPEAGDKLLENLRRTLPELKQHVDHADWVYMTIQPSDDMYLSNIFDEIQKLQPRRRAVGFRKGYIMNYATKEIKEYNPDTIPPFFTIMFPKDIFLHPFKHIEYIGPYKSHEYIDKHLPFDNLGSQIGRGFVVGTHGENISTVFNHPYTGETLQSHEQDSIMLRTGTYMSSPIEIEKGIRKYGYLSKYLPNFVSDIIRTMYYK